MNATELAKLLEVDSWYKLVTREEIANMLRQQADRIAELEKEKQSYKYDPETGEPLIDGYPLYSGLPQTKHEVNGKAVPLSDEEINKAFDYYCETDEGVLRFDYELRKEWKEKEFDL